MQDLIDSWGGNLICGYKLCDISVVLLLCFHILPVLSEAD